VIWRVRKGGKSAGELDGHIGHMRNVAGKLTILQIQRLTKPGLYADGGCLYLQVTGDGVQRLSRSWVYRFMLAGKRRQMGLGSVDLVSLSEARLKTLECRKLHLEGIDPIEVRKAKRAQAALASAKGMTFKACAEKYIASHKAGWKNDKHAAQWPATLTTYAYPAIGGLAVQNIDTALVLRVLEPIWATKAETASRLRGRIEVILDWARVHGYRTGENPARWRGHMDKLLPPRSKMKKVKHHAALPYAELPAFMAKLRKEEGVAARALEFLILTIARTGEVIGAPPNEIKSNIWIVPAERMKAGMEHRVPLSEPAVAIVEKMTKDLRGPYLFPGRKPGTPLSNMAMLQLLERMGRSDLTAHGFRSTFRDWASETTSHESEVIEMALAHTIDSKVEAAYRRGDLFKKRVALMEDWAKYSASDARAEAEQPDDGPNANQSKFHNMPLTAYAERII
jgi:integrase